MKMSKKKSDKPVTAKSESGSVYDKLYTVSRKFAAPIVATVVIAIIGYGVCTSVDMNAGWFSKIAEEKVVSVVPTVKIAENVVLEEVIVGPLMIEEEYMDESERDDYPVAVDGYAYVDMGCTIIVPVITTEVENAAIDRGCVPIELPYIDEIRVCNKMTGACDLVKSL
jgi:hypothetical protein